MGRSVAALRAAVIRYAPIILVTYRSYSLRTEGLRYEQPLFVASRRLRHVTTILRYVSFIVVTYRLYSLRTDRRSLRTIIVRYVPIVFVTYRSYSLRTDRRSLRADRYVLVVTCRSLRTHRYVPIPFCVAESRCVCRTVVREPSGNVRDLRDPRHAPRVFSPFYSKVRIYL